MPTRISIAYGAWGDGRAGGVRRRVRESLADLLRAAGRLMFLEIDGNSHQLDERVLAGDRELEAEVGVDCPWLNHRSVLGTALRAIGFSNFALRGLPLTLAAEAAVTARRIWGR